MNSTFPLNGHCSTVDIIPSGISGGATNSNLEHTFEILCRPVSSEIPAVWNNPTHRLQNSKDTVSIPGVPRLPNLNRSLPAGKTVNTAWHAASSGALSVVVSHSACGAYCCTVICNSPLLPKILVNWRENEGRLGEDT